MMTRQIGRTIPLIMLITIGILGLLSVDSHRSSAAKAQDERPMKKSS